MKNVRKIAVLVLSILVVLVFAKFSLAAQIPSTSTNNTPTNTSTNSSANEAGNNITENNTSNTSNAIGTPSNTVTNRAPINTTNATQNLPSTGIEDTYLNFALILLLAVVLGMFSIVQYRRIIKKEDE